MNDQHLLGYALLALLIIAAIGGVVWQRVSHRRKMHRLYGRRE